MLKENLKKIMLMAILGCYSAISAAEISLLCDSCSAQQMKIKAIYKAPDFGETIVHVVSFQPRLIRSYRVIGDTTPWISSPGEFEDKVAISIQTTPQAYEGLQTAIDYALYLKNTTDIYASDIPGLLTDSVFQVVGNDYNIGNLELMLQRHMDSYSSPLVSTWDGLVAAVNSFLETDFGVREFTIEYSDGSSAVVRLTGVVVNGSNRIGIKVKAIAFYSPEGGRLGEDRNFYIGPYFYAMPSDLDNWQILLETLGFSWSLRDEGDGYYCWSSDAPNGNIIVRCRHAH